MRHARLALGLVALLSPLLVGQEIPKPTEEGQKALERLVESCVKAGGMRREPRPKGKGERLAVADAAKLAAAVKAVPDLPTKPLCDALVAAWQEADRPE